jgi:hypothetical protein
VPTAWLANDRLEGDGVAEPSLPEPMSCTVRGLPAELSVMVRVPFCVPVAVGVYVT